MTDASTVASAIAAVVATGITAVAFILQLRKPPSKNGTAAREMPGAPTKEIVSDPVGAPAQPTETADKLSERTRKRSWLRIAAISLSSGVIAGLIALLIASVWSPGPTVSLTSPTPGTAVSQTKEFNVKGMVNHLGNDSIWLTDYDGGYAVDDEATVHTNGTWTASDSNVGNPGQALPFPLTVRVILADTQCATKLQEAMDSNENYLTALPGGCTVADAVTVKVTTR